eukprot:3936900-Rhodomonas_salina.1
MIVKVFFSSVRSRVGREASSLGVAPRAGPGRDRGGQKERPGHCFSLPLPGAISTGTRARA